MSDPPPEAKPQGAPPAAGPAQQMGFAAPKAAELDDDDLSAARARSLSEEEGDRGRDGRPDDGSAQRKFTSRFAGDVGVSGGYVGTVVTGSQHIHNWSAASAPRQVLTDQIAGAEAAALRAVFVPPPSYALVARLLDDRRVILLAGEPGCGKTTLALNLLLEHHAAVQQIDPSIELDQLAGYEFAPAQGFLVDTLSQGAAARLNRFTLSALTNTLKRLDGRLVVVVPSEAQLRQDSDVRDYLHLCRDRPVDAAVLRKHITRLLGADEGTRARAHGLITHSDVRDFLQSRPPLRDTVKLAQLLRDVADPSRPLDLAGALRQLSLFTHQQVSDWFQDASHSLEERSLMIALCVYAGARRDLLLEADARLLRYLRPKPGRKGAPPAPGYFASARDRLRAVRAHAERSVENMTVGDTEVEIVVFDNPGVQLAALEYVWCEYDQLREPLLEWLYDLGASDDEDLRGYAASATGWLARIDIDTVCNACIGRWAESEHWEARESAALALGVLAGDDTRAANVLALLRRWSAASARLELRLTAAAAYGGPVGEHYPTLALERLVMMTATPRVQEPVLRQVIRSTYRLFQQQCTDVNQGLVVLEALDIWTERSGLRWSIFTGLIAFMWIAKYSQIQPRPGEPWLPTLLWMGLAPENAEVRRRVLLLLQRAIEDPRTHRDALRVALRRWLHLVHKAGDEALCALFGRTLNALARGGQDQRELIVSWLDDRLEEMPDHAATILRLQAALQPPPTPRSSTL